MDVGLEDGSSVGEAVGNKLGIWVCRIVGNVVGGDVEFGLAVTFCVGTDVGKEVGSGVTESVGVSVCDRVGAFVKLKLCNSLNQKCSSS